MLDCGAGRPGRGKVDLHADVNLGEFGLLVGNRFTGPAASRDAIVRVLGDYSFPRLDVVFSASARLLGRDPNDLETKTRLEELELRLVLEPLDSEGRPLERAASPALEVLGLYPYESRVSAANSPLTLAPRVSTILGAVGIPAALSGVVSGLGLTFSSLLSPRFPPAGKAFMAASDEFGWYIRSDSENTSEGLHYGTAFLQVRRAVARIRVHGTFATDWSGGGVDNQLCQLRAELPVPHPPTPETPILPDLD